MLAQDNPTTIALNEVFESFENMRYGQPWPPQYSQFYRVWGYFNRMFDILYPERIEWHRFALFALDPKFSVIEEFIQQDVFNLAKAPCVGNGRAKMEPSESVRIATRTLRARFGLDVNEICQSKKCLSRQLRCSNWKGEAAPESINPLDPNHAKFTVLGATLIIVYQVRNNLFHGSKLEFHGKELERNLFLTETSAAIVQTVVERVHSILLHQNPLQLP